jgi:hypothetical protein
VHIQKKEWNQAAAELKEREAAEKTGLLEESRVGIAAKRDGLPIGCIKFDPKQEFCDMTELQDECYRQPGLCPLLRSIFIPPHTQVTLGNALCPYYPNTVDYNPKVHCRISIPFENGKKLRPGWLWRVPAAMCKMTPFERGLFAVTKGQKGGALAIYDGM